LLTSLQVAKKPQKPRDAKGTFFVQLLRNPGLTVRIPGKAARITCRENAHESGGDGVLEYNAYFDSRGL
jgi:hypothetical protein